MCPTDKNPVHQTVARSVLTSPRTTASLANFQDDMLELLTLHIDSGSPQAAEYTLAFLGVDQHRKRRLLAKIVRRLRGFRQDPQ